MFTSLKQTVRLSYKLTYENLRTVGCVCQATGGGCRRRMFESAVSGLITGSAGALIGLCLVLTYRMAGVINFAQASFGTFGAFTMLQLYDAGWAYLPAAVVGLVTGAVAYLAIEAVAAQSRVTVARRVPDAVGAE